MIRYFIVFSFFGFSIEATGQDISGNTYYPEEPKENYEQKPDKNSDYHRLISKAEELYNGNKFEEADKIYSSIIREQPYNAIAYFGRANCREQLGDFEGALTDFRSVHYLNPEMTEAYFSSAVLEYNLGDYKAAIPLFEQLLELPPGSTQAIYFKGLQYSQHAQPTLTGVKSMADDKDLIIYHYLGKSYYGLEDYGNSEKYFTRAIELDPSAELYVDRGLMRKDGFSVEEAIADLQAAIKLEPDNSLALYWLSNLALESGDEDLSIAALDKVLAGSQPFPEAYIQRGMLKYKAGEFETAIADFDSAIALSAEIPEAYINRGLAKEKMADFSGALRDFSKAIRMNGSDPMAYQFRGNTYFKMKKYEEAVKDYNVSIRLDQQNPKLFYNRALAKNNMQDDLIEAEVCTDLQRAIELGMEDAIVTLDEICEKE